MQFANVNAEKTEAVKDARGTCPSCESEVIAKCGTKRINHWAHKGDRDCDSWWENETEWHRQWKAHFPNSWQEVVHTASSGEKHRADVKTENGWVLEIQHSYLAPEERESRNAFYGKLVWIINATRRKTDPKQFQKILSGSPVIVPQYGVRKVAFPDECRLLNEWASGTSLTFFDFGTSDESLQSYLWFLFPRTSDRSTYIAPFAKAGFVNLHKESKFDNFHEGVILNMMALLREKSQVRTSGPDPLMMLGQRFRNRRRL